jgi:hypothetical protein
VSGFSGHRLPSNLKRERYRTLSHRRIYQLSRDMKINGVPEKVQYETDQKVIAHAKKNLGGLDVEIWEGPRVVSRIERLRSKDWSLST